MKRNLTFTDRGFIAFCIVVALLFAWGAFAISGGNIFRVFGTVFLSFGSLLYVLLAFILARPKPPTLA